MTSTHPATSTVDGWYRQVVGHGLMFAERRLIERGELAAALAGVGRRLRWSGRAHAVFALVFGTSLVLVHLPMALAEGGAGRWGQVVMDGFYITYWGLYWRGRRRAARQLRDLGQRLDAGTLTADDVLDALGSGRRRVC